MCFQNTLVILRHPHHKIKHRSSHLILTSLHRHLQQDNRPSHSIHNTLNPPTMGCTPSKPLPLSPQPPQGSSNPAIRPYKGPSEFRASAMAARGRTQYLPYRPPSSGAQASGTRPDRQVGQMYQVYKKQDQERKLREGRRYSWEGHPTEKVFMTFEQMVERGVVSRDAVKKR